MVDIEDLIVIAEEDFDQDKDILCERKKTCTVYKRKFKEHPECSIIDIQSKEIKENNLMHCLGFKHTTLENIVTYYKHEDYFHLISLTDQSGKTLFDSMYSAKKKKFRKVKCKFAIPMFRDIIHALYHIHVMDLVHTDINPHNFFFRRPNSIKLVLVGLESCQIVKRGEKLNDNGDYSKYNVAYLSPERVGQLPNPDAAGKGNYSDLDDIWAMGVIIVQMQLGKSLFKTTPDMNDKQIIENILKVTPKLPKTKYPDFDSLLGRTIRGKLERITSAEAFINKLFDVERDDDLNLPQMIQDAMLYEGIHTYKGLMRLIICTQVASVDAKTRRLVFQYFGMHMTNSIDMDDLEDSLIMDPDDPENEKKLAQLKNTRKHFGGISVFNVMECIAFYGRVPHENRLHFIDDVLGDLGKNDAPVKKEDLLKLISNDYVDDDHFPKSVYEKIVADLDFQTFKKSELVLEFTKLVYSFWEHMHK